MKKATLTENKVEQTPSGGALVGKRQGQTIIHNKGTLSGYLVGRTHDEGGIKAVNKSTGQPLEMQGGEVVITAPAVSDNTKSEFNGKMMTNREILSEINVKGGGVAFAEKGMEIPKKIKRTGASYKYGGKTMTDHEIYKYITGGGIAEDFSIRDIANIHQVPLSELKEEVKIGMIAESEHKADKKEQMEIVKDHLLENPKYYTLLKKAGLVEEDTAPLEKSKWLKQFYVTNNPSIDKLLKDLQPKIQELIEKQKELQIKESIRIYGIAKPMTELDIQFYEAGLIFKMVQAFNKYLKNTDELYDVSINKRGNLFEVNAKVKRDGRTYKFDTELIDAGGYNIQEYHYRYIIKTDLPSSNENSAVENIKAKMGVLKKIRTIDEDIERYTNRVKKDEEELKQGFKFYKISDVEYKKDLSDFDIKSRQRDIKEFTNDIKKLEGKKEDLISVFESLNKKVLGVNFGKEVKEAIGRKILDRLRASKYKETGDTLDFKIENRSIRGAKIDERSYESLGNINTFSFIDEGNGLCTIKAGLELRGKYTLYAEYKNLPIKEIPYKINEIFNGEFTKYLEYNDGGEVGKQSLVRDAKKGNTPARDLNNYNDVLDIDADGIVGAETGLYAGGGMMANGGLIAPNGKPSGLYFTEIYNLVRTPEFKAWFGDWEEAYITKDYDGVSKIIDENGEPLICVHNSPNQFFEFEENKIGSTTDAGFYGKGFYFFPNVGFDKYGENEYNCFINIKNPYFKQSSHRNYELKSDELKNEGFDGVIVYPNFNKDFHFENGVDIAEEIVAYYSEQIKLADGTNTTFDSSNPDIRFDDGGKLGVETVLFAVRKGEPDYNEVLITNNPDKIEDAKKWALANGFDRLRISKIDMMEKPDFKKTFDYGGNITQYDANMEGDSVDMMFADGGAVGSVVKNWNEVPSIWKDTSKIKKVAWTNSPYDKGLYTIVAPFLGKDELRPIFGGINFDDNGITVTNTYTLITLPYPNKQFEGTYEADLSKKPNPEQITIDGKYPNYSAIIPKQEVTKPFFIDVYKLLQYNNVAMKFANKYTNAVNYKIEDEIVGFNAKFLNENLKTLLKLGHETAYAHYMSPKNALLLSPNKDYEIGNDEIILTMPVMIQNKSYGAVDIDYKRELSVYYDFNDNEIHNADGSIAEFKMNYANNSVISKEDVNLLEKLANGKNRLVILDYVLIENGIARASDLDSEYYLSGVDLPNGVYKTNKGALEITMEATEDYPRSPIFVTDEDTLQFVISSNILEYYIDKLKYVVGQDDLRPVMQGICLHHTSDNKLFLAGTDAHILLRVNITEYVDMPVYNKDMKFIIQPKRLYDFLNSTENTALTIKSNLVATTIQSDNWSFYARNIDGNYPNYDAVMPKETTKLALVNLEPIKKAFSSEMVKNYVKEAYSKDKVFIFNKENEIFIATGTSADNIQKICDTNIDFSLKDYYNNSQSVLLFMPFGYDKQTNFSFRKDLVERVTKIVNHNKLELHYTELNRPYLIPIDSFDYKTTTKEYKVKEQKPSVAEIKLVSTINEVNEIKEAIETLEMLLETATRKDKKEIKEAIEVLQMLLDTYEY
jgi:DNA polymerase III sliding clamp (beta) subunit (PCNA family)